MDVIVSNSVCPDVSGLKTHGDFDINANVIVMYVIAFNIIVDGSAKIRVALTWGKRSYIL